MILLVDVGNTRLKWATWADGDWGASTAVAHAGAISAELLDAAWRELPAPQRILVSCVAGSGLAEGLDAWCQARWDVLPCYVRAEQTVLGVSNAYSAFHELGSDRWLALVAAHRKFSANCCLVDCGSAVTIDLLRRDGTHLGGYILPGYAATLEALARRTALPAPAFTLADVPDAPGPGRSTQACIHCGTLIGIAGAVEYSMKVLRSLTGDDALCVLTGGAAAQVGAWLSFSFRLEPDLVLAGLLEIARNERQGAADQ